MSMNTKSINPIIQNTACHLVMGFLGSGKTSFINACIANFKQQQKWAILVNEAGQIGIDEKLFTNSSTNGTNELAIRQVSGGCICCTSQLPLQIALARLTSEFKPDRLWIEPTGLAHPKELIEQLAAPHWQTALSLKSAISIVNARHWQDVRYRDNESYQAHVRFCDVVVINRFDGLDDNQKTQLSEWVIRLNPNAHLIWQIGQTLSTANLQSLSTLLNTNSQVLANRQHYQQFSLHSFIKPNVNSLTPTSIHQNTSDIEQTLPFRYHDSQNGYQIIGWRLPSDWMVDMTVLMDWLLSLPNWQRIKSVIHIKQPQQNLPQDKLNDDWQTMNFTPDSLDLIGCEPQTDNRIEVIFLDNTTLLDFAKIDTELMILFGQLQS